LEDECVSPSREDPTPLPWPVVWEGLDPPLLLAWESSLLKLSLSQQVLFYDIFENEKQEIREQVFLTWLFKVVILY
jgi:hypothetical protein